MKVKNEPTLSVYEPMANPIMIVDDHEDTGNTYHIFLKDMNCVLSPNRDAAIACINAGTIPSCIVMDYSMPGMSLQTFIEKIESLHIPIVLVSAIFDADLLAKNIGLRYYLPKSATPEAFRATVRCAIQSEAALRATSIS